MVVILYEKWKADREGVLKDLFTSLGVYEQMELAAESAIQNCKQKSKKIIRTSLIPKKLLSNTAKQYLYRSFKPHNDMLLAEMLGDGWSNAWDK